MSPRLVLGLGLSLAALLACIGAFFYGQHVGKTACEAHHAKLDAAANAARDAQISVAQEADAKAATADVQRQTTVREITREVPKIIDRPVYRGGCADADGVQLINRAVDAANGRSPAGGADGDAGGVRQAPADDQSANRPG